MSIKKGTGLLFTASLLFSSQGHSGSVCPSPASNSFPLSHTLPACMAQGNTCGSSGGLFPATFCPGAVGIGTARKILSEDFEVARQGRILGSRVSELVPLKEPPGAVVVVVSFHWTISRRRALQCGQLSNQLSKLSHRSVLLQGDLDDVLSSIGLKKIYFILCVLVSACMYVCHMYVVSPEARR